MKKPALDPARAHSPAPQYPIDSVDKALRVLLLLGDRPELRMTEVAEYLEVASSTAHRLLAMLQYHGFIRQDPRTKAYRPGTSLTAVAFSVMQRFDVRETLRPFLEELKNEFAETVHLAILDGTTVRFIDAFESTRAVRVASRLGQAMPANCTSTGKALLAEFSTEDLHRMYPDEQLETLTVNSVGTRSELKREIERVRRRGYATSNEESEDGVASIAAAFPAGNLPARLAINVSVPVGRLSRVEVRHVGQRLKETIAQAVLLLH
ncbi:IclR family transcriptional regulator [Amycolatopsis sp. CA-161197]|uniref:IclR family transcriptional regulator n=1 Tax=Amycolatopsis sp. CA-161197 TaxID=3239922 RepID=UPI003D8DE7CC